MVHRGGVDGNYFEKTFGQDGVVPGGHRENSHDYRLAVFKAELGEPLLGILIFSLSSFSFFIIFLVLFRKTGT